MFTIHCTSDKIWNTANLVGFLAANQHSAIELEINPEAICLTNLGLYDLLDKFKFTSVTIFTWNPLEQHEKYKIKFKGSNFWFSKIENIDAKFQDWDLTKRFLCFYHRPTAARLGLAGHLWSKHSSQSLIHFSTDDLEDFELDKLLQWDVSSAAAVGPMLPSMPLLLGNSNGYTKFNGYNYSDPLTALYGNILVDVVVESHVAGRTFFPTEKTTRPMLLKKPFIIFGSRDYLAYLRQMGFRTFHDFWNEDYDGYDGRTRLLKIQQLLDNLAQLPISKLETMYWDMQYTLDHNYNLLTNQSYNKKIVEI